MRFVCIIFSLCAVRISGQDGESHTGKSDTFTEKYKAAVARAAAEYIPRDVLFGEQCVIKGLQSEKSKKFNGAKGVVTGEKTDSGRYIVSFEHAGQAKNLALKRSNFEVEADRKPRPAIKGEPIIMQDRVNHNPRNHHGCKGRVLEYIQAEDKYLVEVVVQEERPSCGVVRITKRYVDEEAAPHCGCKGKAEKYPYFLKEGRIDREMGYIVLIIFIHTSISFYFSIQINIIVVFLALKKTTMASPRITLICRTMNVSVCMGNPLCQRSGSNAMSSRSSKG